MSTTRKTQVFVGMSGGVDSSVAAALLQREGYAVTGVFIKVWQADFLPCTWRTERRDAMRAAAHLGIPFRTLDLADEYKKEVVDYMIKEYAAGRVPNPDVMCNKEVKFGAFLKDALSHGVQYVATGHYAKVLDTLSGPRLLAGIDKEKDQSYFLWTLSPERLSHVKFPIGDLEKRSVRLLAKKIGLPNAEKKDSQGLCFLGAVDMRDFLKHFIHTTEGEVCERDGAVIGRHEGALLYTIGQRHGFETRKRSSHEKPYVVVRKDLERNILYVDHDSELHSRSTQQSIIIAEVNSINADAILSGRSLEALFRYRGRRVRVTVEHIDHVQRTMKLATHGMDEFATPGQSVVLYQREECVGGGIVAE